MTPPGGGRVLLTVSGSIPADAAEAVEAGRRPRIDYLEIARALGADLLDHERARSTGGRGSRVVEKIAGRNVLLAWSCFRRRKRYDVVLTDGEQVGLPLALLMWLAGPNRARHVMIVHIMSVPKKAMLYRLFHLGRRIDEMIAYSAAQKQYVVATLGYSPDRVTLSPFMVDTAFFSVDHVESVDSTPRICAAGLEFRDYPTLIDAVRGLGVDVVLAAASPWSKRSSELDGIDLPPNVSVVRLDLFQLRQLYADADIVVMPLREIDFQAGVTTLLEAMAMARPIICSQTTGQTDVITDGLTGVYVPVADADALRSTIQRLLADANESLRLGTAAREWAVRYADIDVYVAAVRAVVERHSGAPT